MCIHRIRLILNILGVLAALFVTATLIGVVLGLAPVTNVSVFVGVGLLALISIGGQWQYRREKRDWNNGVCAASGRPWSLRDYDSRRVRLYSDGQGHMIWISYDVDKLEI